MVHIYKMIDLTQWRASVGLWNCCQTAPSHRKCSKQGISSSQVELHGSISDEPELLVTSRIILFILVKIVFIYQPGKYYTHKHTL